MSQAFGDRPQNYWGQTPKIIDHPGSLHTQKDLFSIKKIKKEPAKNDITQAQYHCPCLWRDQTRQPSKELLRHSIHRHKLLPKVNCNWVHANHLEEKGPAPKPLQVYEPMEHREHGHRIPADHKRERRAPELFVNRHGHLSETKRNHNCKPCICIRFAYYYIENCNFINILSKIYF